MGVTTFTWKQVSELTAKGKPHLVIASKVYDVTNFVEDHPGGKIILTYAGLDASDIFDAFHAKQTHELLADHYVGDLDAKEVRVPTEFVQDCRKLVELFEAQGYFRSNKLYYLFKVAFNLGLLGLSVFTSLHAGDSLLLTALAGVFLAFFWQQCGWLAHDFMHHQVFENRRINNAIGYVIGNIFQGFSVDWWKKKHNVHHAVPNVHGGDPDIDTLPYLAWSDHALELFADVPDESLGRFLVSNQFILFFPLLMFARITWAQQSLFHSMFKPKVPNRAVEVSMLLVHWGLVIYFMAATMTATQAAVYFLTSQAVCGLLLATAFTLNHNGMPVYTKGEAGETDHFTLQIITGRDVLPSIFSNWYTGGLNYQIEHHLFPGVSRHHFHKIAPLVKRTCEKHGVPYHQTGFVDGMAEVVSRLYNVAKAAEKIKSN